jgi:hypothetical protein
MNRTPLQYRVMFMFAVLAVLTFTQARGVEAQPLPTPQVKFAGTEDYEANGQQWTRYKLALLNRSAYADELFAPAPDLPPCGDNKNSVRTWVDIYNREGRRRIYGFCALKGAKDLGYLWFAVEKGTSPPASVYLTITDRRTNTKATSNVLPILFAGPFPSTGRGPDLLIAHFELTDPSQGQVKVEVTNKGAGNSGPSTLRLIVWEPGKFEQKEAKTVFVKVQALHAGQTTTVMATGGVPIINTKYSLYIDISEEVKETNENNNRAEGEAGNFKP